MSAATIGSDLQIESGCSLMTDPAGVQRQQRMPVHHRQPLASLLWCVDEPEEHARFERIQRRLVRLEAALYEDFGSRLDPESRRCILRMFVTCPSVRAPSISVQPDGILIATWRQPNGEELVIRCMTDSMVQFAIVSRATGSGVALNRQWGVWNSPSVFFAENPSARRIAS